MAVSGVFGRAATGSRVLSNSIFANGGLGIDLASDGATPNDPGDADIGPNNLQNFPTLSAAETGQRTVVKGSLNSAPSTTFTLQFFSSPTADPSGFGEGKRFLGQRNVTTDASGDTSFAFTAPATAAGHALTATATSASGDTSEFSKAIPIKKVKPAIIPLTPKPNATTTKRTVKIQATVRDNVTDLAKGDIKLFVDGRARPFSYNPTTDRLSLTAKNLSFKRHTVRIVATDEAGNVAIRSWSFTVKK